jgi:DNA-binding Lrp family transcriptional regulator
MDRLDQEIMMTLEKHGLIGNDKLAHIHGVNERTIRRRISNLLDNNLVKMVVVPNIVLLGYKAWARIGIRVKPDCLDEVVRALVKHPAVFFVAYTLGIFDIVISTHFRTIEELADFIDLELTRIKGIISVETMLLVSPRKYNLFNWPKSSLRVNMEIMNKNNQNTVGYKYELGEIERKMLDILMEVGPIRAKNLASKIGLSENKIRSRLKSMWQNEVYKIEVVPIADILEETQATVGITISQQSSDKIIDEVIAHPSVFLASASLGRFNIILGTRFRKAELFNEFVTKVLPSVSGINSIETFLHMKWLKYRNIIRLL